MILSIIVPSYNSEGYLSHCIDTLLESGSDIEILIVNDGSSDGTRALADNYATKYNHVKAIHQENKGHGGAVNTGIQHATGSYVKVVDSDDWVNPKVLEKVVSKLKEFVGSNNQIDMMLTNFMYDKVGVIDKKVMRYNKVLPINKEFGWNDIKNFPYGKYILMHSVIYRTEMLREVDLRLPEHTFYVDNLFVFIPLPNVKKMYYMDETLYHYFIGREDQSVNEEVMMRRIDQQLRVNRLMIQNVNYKLITSKKLLKYMKYYLTIITAVSSVLLYKIDTDEAYQEQRKLWKDIKNHDAMIYFRMKVTLLGAVISIPGYIGKKIVLFVYGILHKRFGFN